MNELELIVPGNEIFNEETNEFYSFPDTKLVLKHSLLSISKWESKWKVPFLEENRNKPKTNEMWLDYIKCMTISQKPISDSVYYGITPKQMQEIMNYINDSKTASTFRDQGRARRSRQVVTSELIYYWMVEFGIPFDPCEKWHLSRLMTLIRACEVNRTQDKKMSRSAIGKQNEELNRIRRAQLHSRG